MSLINIGRQWYFGFSLMGLVIAGSVVGSSAEDGMIPWNRPNIYRLLNSDFLEVTSATNVAFVCIAHESKDETLREGSLSVNENQGITLI